MDSINRWIRSNEAWKLMLKQFNEYRKLDINTDFATDGPLQDALIEIEKAQSSSGADDAGSDSTGTAAQKAEQQA